MANIPLAHGSQMDGNGAGEADHDGVRDAAGCVSGQKRAVTEDSWNPVPRATGQVPAKPTKARSNF